MLSPAKPHSYLPKSLCMGINCPLIIFTFQICYHFLFVVLQSLRRICPGKLPWVLRFSPLTQWVPSIAIHWNRLEIEKKTYSDINSWRSFWAWRVFKAPPVTLMCRKTWNPLALTQSVSLNPTCISRSSAKGNISFQRVAGVYICMCKFNS
jgi:hypothetical protein